MNRVRIAAFLTLILLSAARLHPAHAADTLVDCKKLFSVSRAESIKADPDDVDQCIRRGRAPSKAWKTNGGENAGIRVGGAAGYSHGSILAPDASPGARGAKASASKEVIASTCSFPPRIKFGLPPKVTFPSGSCSDFFSGLLKDKNGADGSGIDPNGVSSYEVCPIESDSAGLYGATTPITGAFSAPQPCGGMVSLTATDVVLNANPVGLVATEEGTRHIWFYRKTPTGYAFVGEGGLPSYLCEPIGEGTFQKSVDLTLPIAQMITYDATTSMIQIKLQPRETQDLNFTPGVLDPERYLTMRVDPSSGQIIIPPNCSMDSEHFLPLQMKQDIVMRSSTIGGCAGLSVEPTPINIPTMDCPGGAKEQTAGGACISDLTGAAVARVKTNHWEWKCPNDTKPVDGICPQSKGIPPEARCGSAGGSANINCDMLIVHPEGAACRGKIQYGVLNRPSLYLPPESTATFHPIGGRTALMADTVANTQLFTQAQTIFYLQASAAPLTFKEGGTLTLRSGNQLIMEHDALIDSNKGKIKLGGGGVLVSSGGRQLQSYPEGSTYTIGDITPYEVHVTRSVTFPAGYSIPTAPASCPSGATMRADGECYGGNLQKISKIVPYIRSPKDPLPDN